MTTIQQNVTASKLVLLILFAWAGLAQVPQPISSSQQTAIEDVIDQPANEVCPCHIGVEVSPGKTVSTSYARPCIIVGFKWLLRATNIRIVVLVVKSNSHFVHRIMAEIFSRYIAPHFRHRDEVTHC